MPKVSTRTTLKDLQKLVDRINIKLGRPSARYVEKEGRRQAQVGNFHLHEAYSGVCLHEVANKGGAARIALWQGYIPKAAAEAHLRSYLSGLEEHTR